MPIVLPEPYDFHRSTFRFRTFGRDAASVWHDDAGDTGGRVEAAEQGEQSVRHGANPTGGGH